MTDTTMDNAYFNNLMEQASQEGADPTLMADAKKAFRFVPKGTLKAMFESDPSKFYANYASVVCSAVLDSRTDASALASFFNKAKMHEGQENHGFFYNGLRYVAATLLGLVKFAWDTALITVAFTGRFASRLVSNVAKAVVITCVETAGDGKYAFAEVKKSFDRNILGRDENAVAQETAVEKVEAEEVSAVEVL